MATMTDLGRNYYLIQIAIAKKTEEQIVYCYKFLNREMIALNNILFDMYLLPKIRGPRNTNLIRKILIIFS